MPASLYIFQSMLQLFRTGHKYSMRWIIQNLQCHHWTNPIYLDIYLSYCCIILHQMIFWYCSLGQGEELLVHFTQLLRCALENISGYQYNVCDRRQWYAYTEYILYTEVVYCMTTITHSRWKGGIWTAGSLPPLPSYTVWLCLWQV